MTIIELLDGNGAVMASGAQSFLTISIDKISSSQQITCNINSPFGNQNKTLTLSALSATSINSSSTVNIVIGVAMCIIIVVALCLIGLALVLVAWKRYIVKYTYCISSVCLSY